MQTYPTDFVPEALNQRSSGQPFRAALWIGLLGLGLPLSAQTLEVRDASGILLGALPHSEGSEVCLRWQHSVTGGDVADCFLNEHGKLVLSRSYLHDFAAGLGEVEGRGRLVTAADGGYWIIDINEQMPDDGLVLRVGPARVGHRLIGSDGLLDLSAIGPERAVRINLSRPDQVLGKGQSKQ